jgi:pyruvate ferredoxin oxidoreductase gamma subunit
LVGVTLEIRFHGRGGQGAVVASELLAQAAFLDGKMPQSFPFFGVERRGAPVTAYTRIDDRPLGLRTSITTPDVVVVMESSLLRTEPVTDGLKEGGLLLANTRNPAVELTLPVRARRAVVDANQIAVAHGLGSLTMPIVNTAVLGALAGATGIVSMKALDQAIDEFVPSKRSENRAAAAEGFRAVSVVEGLATAAPPAPRKVVPPLPLPEGPLAQLSSESIHTAAWRTLRPVIHLEHCTRCNFCWKFCPDDAFSFDDKGYPVLRAEYCKGCGICAVECPPHVIEMVEEA